MGFWGGKFGVILPNLVFILTVSVVVMTLRSFLSHFGVILKSFWGRFWIFLVYLWMFLEPFGVFEVTLRLFCPVSGQF